MDLIFILLFCRLFAVGALLSAVDPATVSGIAVKNPVQTRLRTFSAFDLVTFPHHPPLQTLAALSSLYPLDSTHVHLP